VLSVKFVGIIDQYKSVKTFENSDDFGIYDNTEFDPATNFFRLSGERLIDKLL
jgi:hypothetical protein